MPTPVQAAAVPLATAATILVVLARLALRQPDNREEIREYLTPKHPRRQSPIFLDVSWQPNFLALWRWGPNKSQHFRIVPDIPVCFLTSRKYPPFTYDS